MCPPTPGTNWSCLLPSITSKLQTDIRPARAGGALALTVLYGLAFLFVGLALLQLALAAGDSIQPATFLPLAVLLGCVGGSLALLRRRFGPSPGDPLLLAVTFFLSGFGLVLIARLAPVFVTRQLFWLALATMLLLAVTLIPKNLDWLRRYKYTWLFAGLALLASTLIFGVNPSGYGARLWLSLGGLYFQPSELLKLLLVVFLAGYLADRRHALVNARAYLGRMPIPHPAYLGPMLLMWGFSMVLLVWQRDLGAALLFFGTFLGMLYAATGQLRYIWAGTLLLIVAALTGYWLFDVVRLRVDAFLDPWLDPAGRSFQIVQSLLAFASGGVLGQGLGQGLPTAIPVVHTDFVFAAIGEEYGLLGALGVLICFGLLVGRAFFIAIRARTEFEQLLAAGIGTLLGLQTIVIAAGTLKLMPLTGVTLPFVSYGGSSLLVSFFMIGLLFFISTGPPAPRYQPAPAIYHLPLARGIFFGLLVTAGGLVLWQVLLSPLLVSRRDNPRLVVAQQKIDRGRLLSRSGIPIAETLIAADGLALRRYPYPRLSSVTGYYSIRYGVGGTEAAFDPILRGVVGLTAEDRFWNDLLHRPLVGDDVQLTIDLPAQAAADVALGDREGAVVLLDLDSGAVLAMASHPTFDPNTLDVAWETLRTDARAPLLNRATQGLFPVGDLARLVALIGLHEGGAAVPPNPATAPLAELIAPLGPTGYRATAHQLGLARPVPGFQSAAGLLPDFPPAGKETARDLAITPLHVARLLAGLDRAGRLPNPTLLLNSHADWQPVIQPATALAGRALLTQKEGQIIGLGGLATPTDTGQAYLSWFAGLGPTNVSPQPAVASSAAMGDGGLIFDPGQIPAATPAAASPASNPIPARYAVVVVVTSATADESLAYRIARPVLNAVMNR